MTIPPLPVAPSTPDTPAKAPSWWRRNRAALIALAVLAPATALAISWQGWNEFYGYGARPVTPILVAADGEAELVGATWGPVRSAEIADLSGFDVPDGAKVIAVAIPVDSGAEGVTCESPVLVQKESGREWESARWEIGLLSDSDEPEYCTKNETGVYELIVPFVLPEDVDGPFWVDLWPQRAGGSFLRFPVDP